MKLQSSGETIDGQLTGYHGNGVYIQFLNQLVECFVQLTDNSLRKKCKAYLDLQNQTASSNVGPADGSQNAKKSFDPIASQKRTYLQSACRQVEFYFSDKNYLKDTYLTSLANKEENRWIEF